MESLSCPPIIMPLFNLPEGFPRAFDVHDCFLSGYRYEIQVCHKNRHKLVVFQIKKNTRENIRSS